MQKKTCFIPSLVLTAVLAIGLCLAFLPGLLGEAAEKRAQFNQERHEELLAKHSAAAHEERQAQMQADAREAFLQRIANDMGLEAKGFEVVSATDLCRYCGVELPTMQPPAITLAEFAAQYSDGILTSEIMTRYAEEILFSPERVAVNSRVTFTKSQHINVECPKNPYIQK